MAKSDKNVRSIVCLAKVICTNDVREWLRNNNNTVTPLLLSNCCWALSNTAVGLRKQSESQGGATFGLNLKHGEKKKYKNFCYINEPYADISFRGDKKVCLSCTQAMCGLCFFNASWGYGNKLIDFFLGQQPPFMFFADISRFWASDNSFATNPGSLVC